jgi:hypothetical protein
MGLSDWAVRLRDDADLAYWLDRMDGATLRSKVFPFTVMRFAHTVESMHAWRHAPSGYYLTMISGAPVKEAVDWFEGSLRAEKDTVYLKPGTTYRPDGWYECADYVWEQFGADRPSPTLLSDDAWVPPPPPPAEWMVHVEDAAQLVATLGAIRRFNEQHPNDPALTLRATKVVFNAASTKRLPQGRWLIAENGDRGTVTGLFWKQSFQWTGRGVAVDAHACHMVRRSKVVLWSAAAAAAAGSGVTARNDGDGDAAAGSMSLCEPTADIFTCGGPSAAPVLPSKGAATGDAAGAGKRKRRRTTGTAGGGGTDAASLTKKPKTGPAEASEPAEITMTSEPSVVPTEATMAVGGDTDVSSPSAPPEPEAPTTE